MYTLTVKIAQGGTIVIRDGKTKESTAGHMWYSLSNGSSSQCYGFGAEDGWPIDDGQMFKDDDSAYQSTIYTATIVIEKWQYDQLIAFGENPDIHGFSTDDYYANSHSCIDFTWKALELVGINPSGFEGDILPDNNGDNVDEAFYKYLVGNLDGWQNVPAVYFDSYDTMYGSKDKDILKVDEKIDFAYGGGDDELHGSKGKDTLYGGEDNDTYIIEVPNELAHDIDYDIIRDTSGTDKIIFKDKDDKTDNINNLTLKFNNAINRNNIIRI